MRLDCMQICGCHTVASYDTYSYYYKGPLAPKSVYCIIA